MMQAIPEKLYVLIVDDQEWARLGLSLSIGDKQPNWKILQAENGQEALAKIQADPPDIILLDVNMPLMDGLEVARWLRENKPDIKIVMLTSLQDRDTVLESMSLGAHAYCMKDIDINTLLYVIQTVVNGALWLDPKVAQLIQQLIQNHPANAATPLSKADGAKPYQDLLSKREQEVLVLMTEGKSNKEIAQALQITANTIKIHVSNIIQKLGVDDRTQVVIKALQHGLTTPRTNV